jgi:hypothetical protein
MQPVRSESKFWERKQVWTGLGRGAKFSVWWRWWTLAPIRGNF